jgi:hypothetical protein
MLPDGFAAVRAEREAAAAQIQRSMKAWRKAGGAAAAANIPKGAGAPLGQDVRGRMESHLGANLSDVRIHTGGESVTAANHLAARAFTVGSDVHFNAGQFSPGSREGDRLLAHELTHVVQGQRSGVQRKEEPGTGDDHGHDGAAPDEVSEPGEPAEQEADAVADQVTGALHDKKDQSHDHKDPARSEGSDKKSSPTPATKAPNIAAKLHAVGRKIYRAGVITLTTVRGDQTVVDANIAISLEIEAHYRAGTGPAPNPAQQRNIDAARAQGVVLTPKVVEELKRKPPVKGDYLSTKSDGSLSKAEEANVLSSLNAMGINGADDRQVVLEAITAQKAAPKITFMSADKNVINSLASASGIVSPQKLDQYRTVAEYLKHKLKRDSFDVSITFKNDAGAEKKIDLTVKPVQDIRDAKDIKPPPTP